MKDLTNQFKYKNILDRKKIENFVKDDYIRNIDLHLNYMSLKCNSCGTKEQRLLDLYENHKTREINSNKDYEVLITHLCENCHSEFCSLTTIKTVLKLIKERMQNTYTNSVINRIFKLMEEKDSMTAYQLAKECDIPNSTISDWKLGKSIPNLIQIIKISEKFNKSTDYLLTGKETYPLTKTQRKITEIFEKADFAIQNQIIGYALDKLEQQQDKAD